MEHVGLRLANRNPDVLTCIANLSNDEVFTPPELASQMLDLLASAWADAHGGASLWADSSVRFLDPFTKSGVFLREITKRLTEGLTDEIPDLEDRVDHILTTQVFGIATTLLTSLVSRRSVYCSKWANGKHSIARSFDSPEGNIWFESMEHTWVGATEFVETADAEGTPTQRGTNGRCQYCGASQRALDRGDDLESHAYALIHTDDINARVTELFGADMQFDVIIGNPPYQTSGGGGGSNDSPIYHHFVEQAQRLAPRFLSMVIQSRWMAGGRGLGDFRAAFLSDRHIRTLVDFENAKDVFPGVGIGGGICYFLWDRDHPGPCDSTYHRNEVVIGPNVRDLNEFDVFVRDYRALEILRKVLAFGEQSFSELVSGDTPFGLASNFQGYKRGAAPGADEILLFANVGTTRVQGAMSRKTIIKNSNLIDTWKVLVPKTGSGRERERSGFDLVLGPSIMAGPASACTQTYLVAGPLDSQTAAASVQSYLRTRFARFLVSLRKPSQDVFRSTYKWVPLQSWDRSWTDEELFGKYGLTGEETAFIESTIRPMGLTAAVDLTDSAATGTVDLTDPSDD